MSTFNVDTDANYRAFIAKRNSLNAEDRELFTENFIRYMCLQHTDSASVSPSAFTTALTQAIGSMKSKKTNF